MIIKSGQKPMHLFDLWGVIINSMEAGLGVIEAIKPKIESDFYTMSIGREDMTLKDAEKYIAEVCGNYKKVLTGELTGEAKKQAIKRAHFYGTEPALDNFDNCFYQDALDSMRNILDNREQVAVYSNDIRPWVKREMPQDITERVTAFFEAGSNGKTSEDFKRIIGETQNRVVSHTADQLQELEAALQSGMIDGNHLIYIDRNGKLGEAEVKEAGIMRFATDIRTINYQELK